MNITTLGIDLAKTNFSIVGMDKAGNIVLRKTLKRQQLLPFIAQCEPCTIGMEACSGAHYWGREFHKLGHTIRIIASKFITPFRKRGKNDLNDAEAICEATTRNNLWFVPVKTADQQAQLCVHRVRQALIIERTALSNQLRGLLSEFGIVMPAGRYEIQRHIGHILEDADNQLPAIARKIIENLWQRIKLTHEQILQYDVELKAFTKQNPIAKRLLTIPGVGDLVASAVTSSVPDPSLFKHARQFAAWLGLAPRQYTTGGHIRLGRITKQGDSYLRACLVHGARAVLANLRDKQDKVSCWARELIQRRGHLRAIVAMAARNARLIWTLMTKQEDYKILFTKVA